MDWKRLLILSPVCEGLRIGLVKISRSIFGPSGPNDRRKKSPTLVKELPGLEQSQRPYLSFPFDRAQYLLFCLVASAEWEGGKAACAFRSHYPKRRAAGRPIHLCRRRRAAVAWP